jgi:hypothetical protein
VTLEWPGPNEKLFQWTHRCRFNACVNYRAPTLHGVANSYKEGADVLACGAAKGEAILDNVILPVVFLYRQYLELTIKGIIETGRHAEEEGFGYPKHHHLRNLWAEAKHLIKEHYKEDAPREIDYIDQCIEEFERHDPESFSFRYPTDKGGNLNLRDISHIDLRNLYETMQRIAFLLGCMANEMARKPDYMSDP